MPVEAEGEGVRCEGVTCEGVLMVLLLRREVGEELVPSHCPREEVACASAVLQSWPVQDQVVGRRVLMLVGEAMRYSHFPDLVLKEVDPVLT